MKQSIRALLLTSALILFLILAPVMTVYALTVPAEINKSFTPIAIVSGGTSTLRVTIYNLNANPLTDASWTDDLVGVQPGLSVADPPNVVNTCGVVVDVTDGGGGALEAGDTSIMLSNGTVPAQVSGFPGDCYVEVDVTSTTPGNLINTTPAGALTSTTLDGGFPVPITNTSPASATLNVIGVQQPSLSKSFAPNTIFVGATSTLTITIHNNDTINPLTETTLTDTLPTSGDGDLALADPFNAGLTGCGPATLTDSGGGSLEPGDTSVRLNNGTIAPDSNCVITLDVTSTIQGAYTNTIPAGPGGPGSIQSREGVTNASPASAPLNVQAFTLTKSFASSPITAGDTSVVTITIHNHASFDYTGVALDDVLPAGIEYVDGSQSTTCTAGLPPATVSIVTTTNSDDTVRLTGGTLPAGLDCTITATSSALMSAAGIYTNDIPIGSLSTNQGATNHAPASDNLVVESLYIAKAFSPDTFAAGQTSTLTITISNPSPDPHTDASVADSLPTNPNSNLYYTGVPTTTCAGGSVGISTTTYSDDTIQLTGGTIPGGSIPSPGTCTITALVTTDADAPAASGYLNTIPVSALTTDEGGTNTSSASDTVNVSTISVDKTFSPSTVAYPNTSLLTITIFNPETGGALTGISLTDTLPAELEIAPYPPASAPDTTCDDSTIPILTAVAGTRDIILSNGSLPAAPGPGAENCTITVYVRPLESASSGAYTNTLGPGSVTTTQGPTNSNTDNQNLTVNSVSVAKAFQYSNFQAGDTNILTITLTNSTGEAYTDVDVSDTLPTSPNSNLEFVPSSEATTCGGTVSLSGTPPRTVALVGGTIPANSTCTINATVTTDSGDPAASYTNIIPIGALTTDEGPSNTTQATADVSVYALGTGVPAAKTFNPTTINIGGNSRLRLTFTAPADTSLTSFEFTDTLPDGVTVSNSTAPSYSGCGTLGGSWPPANGATSIAASGGTIAAEATCRVDVYVTSNIGTGPGIVYTNTVQPASVTDNENRTMAGDISATLTVRTPSTLTISKDFFADVVNPDGLSNLKIILENSNIANLVDVSLDDVLPGTTTNGVVIAPIPNASTTCGSGVITATAGTQTLSMSNGTIPAQVAGVNGICTINVDVQGKSTNGAVPATHDNNIPATNVVARIEGNPSTMNAEDPANASLTVQNLDLEVVKGVVPQLVYGGANSEMSIILRNPNTGAELTGIAFTDNMWLDAPDPDAYPAGEMIIADPPNFDATDCGPAATLIGTAGNSTFSFSGGYLAPGDECTLTLDVTMVVNGNRTNRIPALAVTTFNGARNETPTAATLTNLAGVSICKGFAPNPVASGLESYSIVTFPIRSTATVEISGLGFVDSLPDGLQVAGGTAPAPTNSCGGTLSASPGATTIQLSGGSMPVGFSDCSITVPITGANPGLYTNTIPQGTLETDQDVTNILPCEDTLTLLPYSLGNRIWFDTDNNGLLDGAEVGVNGVRLELYQDDGVTPGVFDSGDTYISFNNTDASGYYRFDDLGSGDYVVLIPADNFRDVGGGDTVGSDPLAGYLSSGTSIAANGTVSDGIGPDPDNDTDDDDNGVTSFTANAVNYVSAQAITLGQGGSEPTSEADPAENPETGEAADDQSNRTVDFGFYRLQLGDLIFQDINENGTYDGGDSVFPGARVKLFASNGTTEINVGTDGILGTADDGPGGVTTGAGGTYLFSGMPAGSYIVKVLPAGYPGTIDTFNPADISNPNTNADDNDNGVGTDSGTNASNVVTLTPGSVGALSNNTVTIATGSTYDPTVDFGYITLLGKAIISTDAAHTVDPKVAIGEIVTYEVAVNVPPAGMNAAQLVDTPQAGLAFVDCISISMPADVSSSTFGAGGDCTALDGTNPATSNPLIENSGGKITFDFGDIANTSGSSQFMTIQYTLIVLDVFGNQNGDSLNNTVIWTWAGGSRITNAPLVEIEEPDMTIDKSVSPTCVATGETVTFTIDLAHSSLSSADAFDVVVTDRIPDGLIYDDASLIVGGSAAFSGFSFDIDTKILTLDWDEFRLAETASVTFQATYVGPPTIGNASDLEWTSLEIDPAIPGPPQTPVQRSTYNLSSTERWYDPAAPEGVNSYGASDSTSVICPLPATGFAPGVITELPEQMLNDAYTPLGDLWLEIPSLGVMTNIVGAPRSDGDWKVDWLWDQAGWLHGTAFPTWDGNSVVTAHVYLPNGLPGPFVDLMKLGWGDQVIVHSYGQRYIYEIRSNRTVSPLSDVFKHEEYPWLTLITCQGYDETSDSYLYRTVVRAVQVRIEP